MTLTDSNKEKLGQFPYVTCKSLGASNKINNSTSTLLHYCRVVLYRPFSIEYYKPS